MKKNLSTGIFIIILVYYMIHLAGCSTAGSVYETGVSTAKSAYGRVRGGIGQGEKPLLKKKILVLPIMDQAGMGEGMVEEVTAKMVNLLNKEGHFIVHKAGVSMTPMAKKRSAQFGIVIDPDLAQMTEEMGMNILITSILTPFEIHSRIVGVWPLKKTKREIEISLVVNVLDITNGTLFLTNLESKKIDLNLDEMEIREGRVKLDESTLNRILLPMLEDHASAVRGVLADQPWTGRLLSADKAAIMINAGKDVGIMEDRVFEVFGEGESIRSVSGKIIYLLGPKIGEIKATEVMQGYSLALPLSGAEFKAGYVIKLKD